MSRLGAGGRQQETSLAVEHAGFDVLRLHFGELQQRNAYHDDL